MWWFRECTARKRSEQSPHVSEWHAYLSGASCCTSLLGLAVRGGGRLVRELLLPSIAAAWRRVHTTALGAKTQMKKNSLDDPAVCLIQATES
jgi:hypothetical protein